MICFLTSDVQIKKAVSARLQAASIPFYFIPNRTKTNFDDLYVPGVTAAVVEAKNSAVHPAAWLDLLSSLGRRIPVIVIANEERFAYSESQGRIDNLTWLLNPDAEDILHVLEACGVVGSELRAVKRNPVPIFNVQIAVNMLRTTGSLSILNIDASQFHNVAIEYGSDVHVKLQDCFREILHESWGAPGNFRTRDILCRRTPDSNTYYVLLEQARAASHLPPPGALEKLADRLVARIQNRLWDELQAPNAKKKLPACLQTIPDFSVGHATALFNPCIEAIETVEALFESSKEAARVQLIRVRNRQRELLQTLIRTDDLLLPHFQAVFTIGDITKQDIELTKGGRDIGSLKDKIFAFESLIRVQSERVEKVIGTEAIVHVDAKFLRPDVLFSLASSSKLSLELDQACLKKAVGGFGNFPFHLMVNVLPRNLYHIAELKEIFPSGLKVTFELSETEDINNFELLLQVRKHLRNLGFGIAADDFGKGYASLDRVLKIEPEIIKLDRSLVQNIDQDLSKKAFVTGLIQATKVSKSKILAEGVETWAEFELLTSMGVDLVQGFLLHRPQSLAEIKMAMNFDAEAKVESVA
jgi:EAL domain-containing protein (putative c-di-GMP-specific phosphodiesterase class I)